MIENAIDEHVSIAITDKNGKIEYANEKFCSVSKYSTEELLMQDHRIINSGYHSKEFCVPYGIPSLRGKFGRESLKILLNIVLFTGYRHNHCSIPRQYVAIWTDETGYKQLEERMEEQVKELARSNDELEHFAYVVTHDLQEPLLAINSFVQLLEKYCNRELDARANDLILHAVAGTNRMQMLIDDL